MTTGALIFAFNNDQIDYLSMARWSARNINRHLGIPTAIVTNKPFAGRSYEHVIRADSDSKNMRWFWDYNTNVVWHNTNRMDAYNLSPWDQTLVLDSDYIVASDQLQTVLSNPSDFLAHRWAYDVTGLRDFDDLNYFGYNQMPMWWATVMMFRRSDHARLIFETMSMIKDHWDHYRDIYKNPHTTYRNDHALTIALGVVNGHTLDHAGIPWKLASLTPEHKLKQLDADHYRIDFLTPDQRPRWIELKNQDLHAMGKQQLGEIVANPC